MLGVQGWRAKAKPMYSWVIVAAGDSAIATAPTPLILLAEYGKIKTVADAANITINYSE
jgi:hypothetical protein